LEFGGSRVAEEGKLKVEKEKKKEEFNAEGAEKWKLAIVGCHGPSTARADALKGSAEEKVGPLRSG
jgi:hypothetical protein